ncbi:MAG: hypothetical protein PSX36_03350 [bacterium]|nr:hypothetical protein [bacterium]
MKHKLIIIVSAVIWMGISSCQKTKNSINEATEFTINYTTTVAIPSSSISVTAPADFTSPQIPTTSSSRFAAEKTTQELIDEIKMTTFNLSNPNGNLNFLKSITIFIKTAGLPDVQVATKTNIPQGATSVAADLSGANIKDYIFKDNIQFRVTVTITTGLTADQSLKIDQTVTVKGKKIK